jgi:hypothetical protein
LARLFTLTLLCFVLAGCELIADFDRSKIPDEPPAGDSGIGEDEDAAEPDSAVGGDASSEEDASPGDEDAGPGDEDAGPGDEDAG